MLKGDNIIMSKFYALATNENGKTVPVHFEDNDKQPEYLFQAEAIAKSKCKENNLTFVKAYIVQGTQKQGSTMTKFKKTRTKTGNNGKYFAKAL